MTIITMIALSALILVCLSHLAAARAEEQRHTRKSPAATNIRSRH